MPPGHQTIQNTTNGKVVDIQALFAFYDTVQELLDEISVKNLTDEEAAIITKKLGKEWGNPSIDYLIEAASEALFENDDEDEDY